MTMAESTNGQDNDGGRVSVALRSTAGMARRKLLPWLKMGTKLFILLCWHEIELALVTKEKELVLTWYCS